MRHTGIYLPTHFQWLIIDSKVYDVTKFKDLHPGGVSVFFEEGIC